MDIDRYGLVSSIAQVPLLLPPTAHGGIQTCTLISKPQECYEKSCAAIFSIKKKQRNKNKTNNHLQQHVQLQLTDTWERISQFYNREEGIFSILLQKTQKHYKNQNYVLLLLEKISLLFLEELAASPSAGVHLHSLFFFQSLLPSWYSSFFQMGTLAFRLSMR